MIDGTNNHSTEVVIPLSPVDLLWAYAYSISDRRAQQEAWLDEREELLFGQNTALLSMHDRQALAEQEVEYRKGYTILVDTKADEAAVLNLLERLEDGTVDEEEVLSFIPPEFIEEEINKSKTPEPEVVETGLALSRSYLFAFSPYLRPLISEGREPERLTTGRNLKALNARGKLLGSQAVDEFFYVTADTHGGKVRGAGKNGSTYTTKLGKVVRKA